MARSLSHGEQRQLEVGVALAGQPRILMLDEPAAGLSPGERDLLSDLLLSLDPAITVLLVEHDIRLIASEPIAGGWPCQRARKGRSAGGWSNQSLNVSPAACPGSCPVQGARSKRGRGPFRRDRLRSAQGWQASTDARPPLRSPLPLRLERCPGPRPDTRAETQTGTLPVTGSARPGTQGAGWPEPRPRSKPDRRCP